MLRDAFLLLVLDPVDVLPGLCRFPLSLRREKRVPASASVLNNPVMLTHHQEGQISAPTKQLFSVSRASSSSALNWGAHLFFLSRGPGGKLAPGDYPLFRGVNLADGSGIAPAFSVSKALTLLLDCKERDDPSPARGSNRADVDTNGI
ncbi:collagen alpha-2(XI) chain [Lates japonicus]|uniref:Collagen alpha-2(XI) chain n=1 Tax=Lates japonicus TaxID=270547 RepID=A0AAD3R8W6_LATJO|nr:collagen alpha-2(XI) chain [Lates japonicus]